MNATLFACTHDLLNAHQREDLALGDLFARVREEIELSRAHGTSLLMPGTSAIDAANALTLALRFEQPGSDRGEILRRAAVLMAIGARLVLEGTPVFPNSMPGGGR